jgi:hypothetical protein
MATTAKKSTMGQEHKDALALGRTEGRIVRSYLDALEAHKPKRGRKRTVESVERDIAAHQAILDDPRANALSRLLSTQAILDLQAEAEAMASSANHPALYEDRFIEIAASYSERRGISYAAWRAVGVPADVLKRAGIHR